MVRRCQWDLGHPRYLAQGFAALGQDLGALFGRFASLCFNRMWKRSQKIFGYLPKSNRYADFVGGRKLYLFARCHHSYSHFIPRFSNSTGPSLNGWSVCEVVNHALTLLSKHMGFQMSSINIGRNPQSCHKLIGPMGSFSANSISMKKAPSSTISHWQVR